MRFYGPLHFLVVGNLKGFSVFRKNTIGLEPCSKDAPTQTLTNTATTLLNLDLYGASYGHFTETYKSQVDFPTHRLPGSNFPVRTRLLPGRLRAPRRPLYKARAPSDLGSP